MNTYDPGPSSRFRGVPRFFACVLLAAALQLVGAVPVCADWVGTKINRLFLDPDSIPVVLDGYQNGDVISYILETTPEASAGADKTEGFGAWATIYVPAGVEVVDAELVELQGDGTYDQVPAKDMDDASDDCGKRGCLITIVPNQIDNGFLNRSQQDTGIFYSTDARTAVQAAPFTSPVPTGIKNPPQFWNIWDRDQDLAFGHAAALSGNTGKGNTAVVSTDGGTTWAGVGSPVAGPLTYYTNDYNPACDANGTNPGSTAFYDDIQCVGPWQRIAYSGAKMGYSGPVTPATGTSYPANVVNTAVPTTLGFALSTSNPLPSTTKAVRFVQGIRHVGQLETGRITFRITNYVAFTAAFRPDLGFCQSHPTIQCSQDSDCPDFGTGEICFLDTSFCLDAIGGDYGGPDRNSAQDNPWRYYEGDAHKCFEGDSDAILFKAARFVNGVPSGGVSVVSGDVIAYELTFTNTSGGALTNIALSDTPALNLTLLEPGASPNCPYGSYDGDLPGPTYTAGSATAGTATWANIPSLAAAASVTVQLCAQVNAGLAPGVTVSNCGDVTWDPTKSDQSCANGSVSNRITGTVYVDQDNSGGTVATVGDTPLLGVTVALYRDDGDGVFNSGTDTLVDTDVTDAQGGYAFDSVCVFQPGKSKCTKNAGDTNDFWVVETDLFSYSSTGDSDTATGCTEPADPCDVVSVPLFHFDDASDDNDFFDISPATLGDLVWLDVDGDGIQDVGEPGIANVTVNLTGFGPDGLFGTGDDVAYTAQRTGVNGEYDFTELPPGQYRVDVDGTTIPAGLSLSPGSTDPLDVTLTSGQDYNDADFGYYNAAVNPSSGAVVIGDFVWSDADGDGVQDPGEPGIAGVTLDLRGPGSDGILGTIDDAIVATAATGPDGRYLFSGTTPPVRVTEYYIATGDFTGNTYDLTLSQPLAPDYFVIIQGSDGTGSSSGSRTPAEDYVRLSADPLGTGDLGVSAGADIIGLQRRDNAGAPGWVGVVTVVESLSAMTTDGFRLLDVNAVAHTGMSTSGTAASGTSWSALSQVMLMGGFNGAGCDTVDAQASDHKSCHARIWPSGTNTINWTRDAGGAASLADATSTVMVVEWGSAWTVQRINVTGTNGGDGADATSEYTTGALGVSVARANTWVWGTGHTDNNGIGDAAEGVLVTLGDGVNKNSTESTVAIATENSGTAIDFEVYALTHASLAVDYQFKTDGDSGALTVGVPVSSTTTNRMALIYNGQNGTGTAYPRPMFSARYLNGNTVRLERRRSGQAFPAWVQGIDFSGFQTIPPGDYIVDVTDTGGVLAGYTLTSGPQSNPDPTYPITVNAGDVYLDADFGYVNAALHAISDRAWYDTNGDGLLGAGESGLAGVAVNLLDAGGNVIATTSSAPDGKFSFAGLPDGNYTIQISDTGGVLTAYSGTTADATAGQSAVTLAGLDVTGTNFGYNAPGVIGDTVWSDADGDGVQDAGEPGIAGVTVELWEDTNGNGTLEMGTGDGLLESTTTATDGSYLFTDLDPGTYFVSIDDGQSALTGYTLTTADDQAAAGAQITVILASGGSDLTADFGYRNTGLYSIGDRVWVDANANGYQDPDGNVSPSPSGGELGVAGVTVDLLDAGGALIATTTTGCDPATVDTYRDQFGSVAYNNSDGSMPWGGNLWVETNDPGAPPESSGEIYVTGGELRMRGAPVRSIERPTDLSAWGAATLSFDFRTNGTLEPLDVVVVEVSRDGVNFDLLAEFVDDQNPGSATFDISAYISATTTTTIRFSVTQGYTGGIAPNEEAFLVDNVEIAGCPGESAGYYKFDGLPNGSYQVEVTDRAGVLAGYSQTGATGAVPVTVSGADVDDVDFGYARAVERGRIGDLVWLDGDRDGVQDQAEGGIPGVTLRVYLDDGDGSFNAGLDTLVGTTATDASGRYVFDGLPAGNYFVDLDQATLPAGLSATTGTSDPRGLINLSAGGTYLDADFGYASSTGSALGDFVWYDANGDGVQDAGETGIGGVVVEVLGLLPGGDTCRPTPCTVTTDATGFYLKTGLNVVSDSSPNYQVTVASSNFDPGGALEGYSGPTNGNASRQITVPSGKDVLYADFGYNGGTTGSIGDLVWFDADGNGLQDDRACSGGTNDGTSCVNDSVCTGGGTCMPAGIADVTVNLLDGSGNVLATTTTDDTGAYDFVGLAAGSYKVEVTDINGVLVNLTRTVPATNPTGAITLAAGQDYNDADFGYTGAAGLGTIGTQFWHDLNDDKFFDFNSPEPGFQGVSVDLWLDVNGNGTIEPGTDNLVRRAYTRVGDGHYEFLGLPFGNYAVTVSDVNGVLAGFTHTVSANQTADNHSKAIPYAVTINGANPNNYTADFGYIATLPHALSGTVFHDINNNASLQVGTDVRIPQITVNLYRDLNGDGVLDPGDPRIGVTQTGTLGGYSFTDLPDGNYIVTVDGTGTRLDAMFQTTQTATGGVEPVALSGADSPGHDFGFWAPEITTTPVTLAYFEAQARQGGGVHFEWATVTETGNVGFDLYAVTEDGPVLLNREPIASQVVDSVEPQYYGYDASRTQAKAFVIDDLDIFGRAKRHGPFALGRGYGEAPAPELIDWTAVRRERAAKAELRRSRARLRSSAAVRRGRRGEAGYPRATLKVSEDGLYRVSYEELRAAGVDLAGAPARRLALQSRGEPVPVYVETPSGNTFGPGAFVEFYGEALDSMYTHTDVYTLSVNRKAARRVKRERHGAPRKGTAPGWYMDTVDVDRDLRYSPAAPNDDPWYETRLLAYTSPVQTSFALEADHYVAGAGPVVLSVRMSGVTDWPNNPDHHVEIDVNGSRVADEIFDGLVYRPVRVELAPEAVVAGANTLVLRLPGDTGVKYDLVYLDGYALTYPRGFVARDGELKFSGASEVYEVSGLPSANVLAYRYTERRRPRRLANITVQAAGDGTYTARLRGYRKESTYVVCAEERIRTPQVEPARVRRDLTGQSADYLIISHADFIDGLGALIAAREAEGHTVLAVDVEDLYAQYSDGITDPEAIREYIAYAAGHLGTKYVLLVGGDTYDYLDNLGQGSVSFIPSPYAQTDQLVHFAPVDPLYADTDRDGVPDLALGRLPVRTTAELATVIGKTLQYAEHPLPGTAVFAADRQDGGVSFAATSEGLISKLPASWAVDRAYVDDLGVAGARDVLISALDQGVALASFVGHSGPTQWTFEKLFSASDAAVLSNVNAPALVTQWGCWNTYYVSPGAETLGHQLLLAGPQGAAAVVGAVALTESTSEDALGRRLMAELVKPGQTLGEAIVAAKQNLAQTDPERTDVLLGWTLLGDPALKLSAP